MKMYGSLFLSGGKKKYCLTYVILKNLDLLLTKISPRKKKIHPRKFLAFYPRNPNFNPRKNIILCPRKLQSARENFRESGRENDFPPEKKPKEVLKNGFSRTFRFLG